MGIVAVDGSKGGRVTMGSGVVIVSLRILAIMRVNVPTASTAVNVTVWWRIRIRKIVMARETEKKARMRVVSLVRKLKRGWREGMLVGRELE